MTTYSNVSLCFRSGVLPSPISCLAWWLWPFVHLSICKESHNLSSLLGMSLVIEVDLVGFVSLLLIFLNKTWFCVTKSTAIMAPEKFNQSNCIYDAHEDSDICMHAVPSILSCWAVTFSRRCHVTRIMGANSARIIWCLLVRRLLVYVSLFHVRNCDSTQPSKLRSTFGPILRLVCANYAILIPYCKPAAKNCCTHTSSACHTVNLMQSIWVCINSAGKAHCWMALVDGDWMRVQ